MGLNRLIIENVRSVSKAELSFSNSLNVIFGGNGEGKTSLLEAIHILSLGRSFRTRHSSNVISHGKDHLTVGGNCSDLSNTKHTIGVRLSKKQSLYKIDRQRAKSISQLSSEFPVVVFTPDTPNYFLQQSTFRRAYLDWGCFQASPSFLLHWQNYTRILKQRNAALRARQARSLIQVWDEPLASASEIITMEREKYLGTIQSYLEEGSAELSLEFEFDLVFRKGAGEKGLKSKLTESIDSDSKRGFTQYGCHRDDFVIRLNKKPLVHQGSRGQIKICAFALILLQVKVARLLSDKEVVFLLDDLASEFDSAHFKKTLEAGLKTGSQLFISSVQPFEAGDFPKIDSKMFHVKQGVISEA